MYIIPYTKIARPDHWFKNVFMVLGIVLAFFIEPELVRDGWYFDSLLGLVATSFVASSNYVLNEILDSSKDAFHPTKKKRPIPSGQINILVAYIEWLLLAVVGLGVSYLLSTSFFLSALSLWIMGICYNVPPIRTKEIPYIDVLSESINNPIRLFLGWFVLLPHKIPPLSLVLAYWMAGAFFMGIKRFAEYKTIGNKKIAASYRKSFGYYDENKLLISIFYYAVACSFFLGIFIVKYHLELILSVPLLVGLFAYYLKVGFRENSPVQHPEKLYKEIDLMCYLGGTTLVFVLLLFVEIPSLYQLFKVVSYNIKPLWEF